MQKNILIIGGGIIGLCCAYYLRKEGHQVTVIDQSDFKQGASFVNAGYITPSHIIPLAAPGMISKGIKWMFNSASPFYIKPRWDTDFFRWAWYFHKSSTREKVAKAVPVIKDINIISRTLYSDMLASGDLGDFHWEQKGLLMLYKTDKAAEEELHVAELAKAQGLEVEHLNSKELQELEPEVDIAAKGGIYYKCDAHSTPTEIMPKLINWLKTNGVILKSNEVVQRVSTQGGKLKQVQTNTSAYSADEVVVAAGSWSQELAKKLHLNLWVQAGKGYRIDVHRPTKIKIPAILIEAKVAMTPMNGFTRFAGTMEFSGINTIIRPQRVEAISQAAKAYYPAVEIQSQEKQEAKSGLRPVSPDGLPYIGKSHKYSNVTFATAHAMMGWSLGPATGKLVSELISDHKVSMDISAFHPDRKF